MPSESLILAVTSGLGVGIFAGIVSGVCYIVVTGFTSKRPRNSNSTRWHCSICGVQFPCIENLLESGRVVTCIKCGTGVCRARCSKLIKDTENQKVGWFCRTCQHPESWFKGILRAIHPSSEGMNVEAKEQPEVIDEMDEDLDCVKRKDEQHVKGFIERLVEAMLGNNIDNACVTRMYNDQKYLPVLGQSPCSAHASLRLLIQRIIQEAIGLPPLEKNDTEIEMNNGEITNNSYEDLLATAILNKVVENYQDELGASKTNSVSSRMTSSSVCQNEKEYYFGTETLCSKWQSGINAAADMDAASVSSSEDWIRSDSSVGSTKYVDSMSLRIQQRIDEESSTDEEPKVKPVLNQTLTELENEWQENWLMQKRPFGRNSSPVPVPMLVPNPSSEAKVLIGDREADDTTDLSDACSDMDEVASSHSIENILVNSKTVIGGKNVLSCSELPNNLDFQLDAQNQYDEKHLSAIKEDILFASFESQTEQDTEYTEKYATLPRTITILKTSTPNSEKLMENVTKPCPLINNEHDETDTNCIEMNGVNNHNGYHDNEAYDDATKETFKGSYSEREKEKWNNAVEMKNNPYSSENLKQRLSSQSTNSISSLFSNKDSTQSASIKSKASSIEKPISVNADILNGEQTPSEFEKHVYTAVPDFVQVDNLLQTSTAHSEAISSISSSIVDISSDSDLSIERVYNLPSGNVYINGKSNEFLNTSDHGSNTTVQNSPRESIEKSMNFSLEFSTDESLHDQTTKISDPEITQLCDKHLVKDLLGQFSRSYPSLNTDWKKDDDCENYKSNVPLSIPKHGTSKTVHSITARSIPREFRNELKREARRSSASAAILHEEVSKVNPEFPIAKSKIKFFESLK